MSKFKIRIDGEKAEVFTPFNRDFVSALKKGVGGSKWNGEDKCWIVPAASVDAVRKIMKEVFGETDLPLAESRVTVKVTFNSRVYADKEDYILFCKVISHAWGRDSGAKPGEDVTFIEGQPTSGGSVKNWLSVVNEGCVVLIRNVPQSVWEAGKDGGEDYTAELFDEGQDARRLELENEKAALLARLEEINRLLNKE